jgi:DNA-binding NtrC family response regulator
VNDPIRVLLVDDNEDLLETFTQILRRKGFYVENANNGLTAVERYFQGEFDVTLMDIVMPELNGVEAFQLIRKIDTKARVILMTGYSDDELMQVAIDKGAWCILHKPIRADKLINMIYQMVPAEKNINEVAVITVV